MTGKEKLIYLSIQYNGDYQKIVDHIIKRLDVDENATLPKLTCKALTILDEEYPEVIKHHVHPPIVLFYYGDISLIKDPNKNLAVVGTRNATQYGLDKTNEIVSQVAKEYNIVSGLALGIDAMAHQSAISAGGKTIAVLGCGIDRCYPSENKELYEIIKEKHLVISEYPFNYYVPANSFPFRNRLIVMFSKGVLISEAFKYSGTSITANFALNYNKDVLCVPYSADCDSFCNRLIAQGAFLVENAEDVFGVIGHVKKEPIFEN